MLKVGFSAFLISLALTGGYFAAHFFHKSEPKTRQVQYQKPINPYFGLILSCDESEIKSDLAGSETALIFASNCSWKGQFKKADRFYKMALDVRKKELGPAAHPTLLANMCYFDDLMRQSRFVEAERLAKEAVADVKRVPKDLWFIGTSDRVSEVLVAQKKYKEAIEIQKEILKFSEKFAPLECKPTREKIDRIKIYLIQNSCKSG